MSRFRISIVALDDTGNPPSRGAQKWHVRVIYTEESPAEAIQIPPAVVTQEDTPLALCTPHELLRTEALSLLADCVNRFGLDHAIGPLKAGTAGCPGRSTRVRARARRWS